MGIIWNRIANGSKRYIVLFFFLSELNRIELGEITRYLMLIYIIRA